MFGQETSLGEVYKGLLQGDKALQLQAYLEQELGLEAASSFVLPTIKHAPGFEKYSQIAAGALAHEAGYDAFMTGEQASPGTQNWFGAHSWWCAGEIDRALGTSVWAQCRNSPEIPECNLSHVE